MKPAAGVSKTAPAAARAQAALPRRGLIHPVVIYPFEQPSDVSNVEALYEVIARVDGDRKRFARPLTVVDRKTEFRNRSNPTFLQLRKKVVARASDVLDAWCVDTCQMWYAGLGYAFERGAPGDVYWLIPGDFNYGTATGQQVLQHLLDLPAIISELGQDLCIGEIATDHSHSKQIIDTYGTFALLYNWFPAQAAIIRQMTERPRSEFLAASHSFLGEALQQRWYAYEQTVVMLLHAARTEKRISRFFVGELSDLPAGSDSFPGAFQQVERTERVLKSLWRELNQIQPGWVDQYEPLERRSDEIRKAAWTVLRNLLA